MIHKRIHILGASGSGTSTLGRSLSELLDLKHLDTDDFYWVQTHVPFTKKNPESVRIDRLRNEFEKHDQWVLSGSLCGWGDELIPLFTHVVFLYLPWDVRHKRLFSRERDRYGQSALGQGGKMHDIHRAFMGWASKYDCAGFEQRSYVTHDHWLNQLPSTCTLIRLEDSDLVQLSPDQIANLILDLVK